MRSEIKQLKLLGPLPSENEVSTEQLQTYEKLLKSIHTPISNEEARFLVSLFDKNPDDCFGIAWTILHLIETAPSWPLKDCLEKSNNEWVNRLVTRAYGADHENA